MLEESITVTSMKEASALECLETALAFWHRKDKQDTLVLPWLKAAHKKLKETV